MRLKIDDENTQYTWHVQDPKIQELFEKQLSKHSVGAYVTLTDEAGLQNYRLIPLIRASHARL